jgi:hypothetical protein
MNENEGGSSRCPGKAGTYLPKFMASKHRIL